MKKRKKNFLVISHRKKVSLAISHCQKPHFPKLRSFSPPLGDFFLLVKNVAKIVFYSSQRFQTTKEIVSKHFPETDLITALPICEVDIFQGTAFFFNEWRFKQNLSQSFYKKKAFFPKYLSDLSDWQTSKTDLLFSTIWICEQGTHPIFIN